MVDKELLELIVCPESHQDLREASAELVARLNARIARGELANRGKKTLTTPIVEGLLRADGRVLYPVTDGIPMLLVEEGIDVKDIEVE